MAYFEHSIGGVALDLAHLEPRTLRFFVKNVGRELAIDVKFSNHCFTVAYLPCVHSPTHRIMDASRARAYDPERHGLSHNLPALVDALPDASVYLTASDRNYVYLANVALTGGRIYPMYFRLKRFQADPREQQHQQQASHQLQMVVESAYPIEDRQEALEGATKISFAVLCAKVYKGEQVRSRLRR